MSKKTEAAFDEGFDAGYAQGYKYALEDDEAEETLCEDCGPFGFCVERLQQGYELRGDILDEIRGLVDSEDDVPFFPSADCEDGDEPDDEEDEDLYDEADAEDDTISLTQKGTDYMASAAHNQKRDAQVHLINEDKDGFTLEVTMFGNLADAEAKLGLLRALGVIDEFERVG